MPIENELKFLFKIESYNEIFSNSSEKKLINQGYLNKNTRIRSIKTNKIKSFYFTFKQITKKGLIEIETEISKKDFQSLWELTKVRICKERYIYKGWEIDFYYENNENYGALAEIELKENQKNPKNIPKLIKKNILYHADKHDVRFFNMNLTKNKMKKLYKELKNEKR